MAAVSVRGLEDVVKEQLRVRAATNGRSLEAEIRVILTEAVRGRGERHLGAAVLEAFGDDGVELELPSRSAPVRAPDLS